MFKEIMTSIGLKDSKLSAEEVAELERVTQEDRLVELSLKAHKNDGSYHADLPTFIVTEITDPEVVRATMEDNFSLDLLPNQNEDGTTVSKIQYQQASNNRERDPWGSVSKRSVR